MSATTETLEERIRERAYYMWEASGRPSGRDTEFWNRACELVTAGDNVTKPATARRQAKSSAPRRATRSRQTAK
ncbi:MAG TPA: DUF2934 domain-containing protein [Acetobacteraceae bacterium]|nr:DUF2934 domain-containing protein [Acetobacteraceae bacterium]